MLVKGSFSPHQGSGKKLSTSDAVSQLLELGIERTLILKDAIDDAIWNCEDTGVPVHNIEVARGIEPEDGEEEHIKLLLNPQEYVKAMNHIRRSLKKQRINYKNFSHLCILEKDTPVALTSPALPGKNGMNVKGEELPCRIRQFESIKVGEKMVVNESGDILTAEQGEYLYENNTLSINLVLNLKKGVNFHTGNVHFPGSVEIHGEVKDGFSIHVGKDLHVYETLMATDVLCGGNLIIHGGGIIGRKEHRVLVEQSAESNFVERVHLEAKEEIRIKKEAYLSKLYTNGKILFQSGGKLVGGETYSQNGLEINDLGNKKGLKTIIYSGIDYKLMKMLIQIKSFRESLMDLKLKNSGSDQKDLDQQILKCNLSMEYLLEHLDNNENAKVTVNGTVYPGTEIHICNAVYEVRDEMSRGYFQLNKAMGSIEFTSL
jgi:uncharacterized protein (DUF342 family)